jgi:hypothetical protein
MPSPQPGFAHPYFPARDPERRWLFKLELTVPSIISTATTGGANSVAEVLAFNAQSVTLPSVTIDPIIIPHMNQDVKVAGRPSLGEMTVVYLNAFNLRAVSVLESWHRAIYKPSTETLGFATQYKTNGTLLVLCPNLEVFKTYQIMGCWPSSIGDKEYDWSASENVTRTVTFQVDKILDPHDQDGSSGGVRHTIPSPNAALA